MAFLAFLAVFLSVLPLRTVSQVGPSNWTASPFNPPALPLAVRTPYLNVWTPQGNDPNAAFDSPNFPWLMSGPSVGWYVSVVVDDREYRMLSPWAAGELTANQSAVEFTATRTSFLMTAAGVQFNMSFLSPIEPKNYTLQSLPFAYLYITAEATDGQFHRVLMYSDIQAGLATGDASKVVKWTSEDSTDYVVLGINLQSPVLYIEENNRAQDATVYYSFKKIPGTSTSWTISGMNNARGRVFANAARAILDNQAETDFRPAGSGDNTPSFGMLVDWGNITSTPEPAVWSLGVYRNPSVQYMTPEGSLQDRSPYFASTFRQPVDAVKFVLDDFPRALSAAIELDAKVQASGEQLTKEYADILALTARQAFGTMDITIPSARDGAWDTSDVKIFLKNIGSVGSDNRLITSVNTVDVLYAAFPAFLYFNSDIGGHLLVPLLEHQDPPAYPLPYAAKNLGPAYPVATAEDIGDAHSYGIEESANMIIMVLAHALASGNGTLIANHYELLRGWADYLANNTLAPINQSTGDFGDDFTQPNQTNLALKGIIAIAAMARISEVTQHDDDRQRFNDMATSGIQYWQDQAISSSRVEFYYGAPDTSGIIYNLYADRLLHLDLVPESVYDLLTSYYQNTASQSRYGIPLNSSPNQNTTTHWMMFAAATCTDNTTRDLLVSQVHSYASDNINANPFTSNYDPATGIGVSGTISGIASPAQGGLFALLAPDITRNTIITTPAPSNTPSKNGSAAGKSRAGAIAGGTIGGISLILCIAVGVFLYRRRQNRRRGNLHHKAGVLVNETRNIAQPFLPPPASLVQNGQVGYFEGSRVDPRDAPHVEPSLRSDIIQQSGNSRQWGGSFQHSRMSENTSNPLVPSVPSGSGVSTGVDSSNKSSSRTQDAAALHYEVAALRRDLELMRREREASADAPPGYSDVM